MLKMTLIMNRVILKFFYSSFLLIWVLAGVVLLTADYCVGLYDSMESGLPSVGQLVFYLSLLVYLLVRLRYKRSGNESIVLVYLFLFFWVIMAAISVM